MTPSICKVLSSFALAVASSVCAYTTVNAQEIPDAKPSVPQEAAQTEPTSTRSLHILGLLGFTIGGDKLVSGTYANTGNSYSISAGGGSQYGIGIEWDFMPDWSVRGVMGWHNDSTNASNGEIKFQRNPKHVAVLYSVAPNWRVGAGIRSVEGGKLTCSGAAGSCSNEFKGSSGPLLLAQYLLDQPANPANPFRIGFEASYAQDKYTGITGTKKGDHFGLSVILRY